MNEDQINRARAAYIKLKDRVDQLEKENRSKRPQPKNLSREDVIYNAKVKYGVTILPGEKGYVPPPEEKPPYDPKDYPIKTSSDDAIHRAVKSGFETNRKRH